jgi:hypothetical protein
LAFSNFSWLLHTARAVSFFLINVANRCTFYDAAVGRSTFLNFDRLKLRFSLLSSLCQYRHPTIIDA